MNKKTYTSPHVEEIALATEGLLAISVLGDNVDISYGGDDVDGLLDPQAPLQELEDIILGL